MENFIFFRVIDLKWANTVIRIFITILGFHLFFVCLVSQTYVSQSHLQHVAFLCLGKSILFTQNKKFNTKRIKFKVMIRRLKITTMYLFNQTQISKLIQSLRKNTVISPSFLVWKFCGKSLFFP